MGYVPLALPTPDLNLLASVTGAWRTMRSRTSSHDEFLHAVRVLETGAARLAEALLRETRMKAEYNRNPTSPVLCLTGGGGMVRHQLDLKQGDPGILLADIAVRKVYATAYGRHVDDHRSDGGTLTQEMWDNGVMHHPAILALEAVAGRLVKPGRPKASSNLLIRSEGVGRGDVVVHPGSPVVPWAGHRPTRMEIGLRLPETVVLAMAGRTLGEVMESGLSGEAAEAFSKCRIASSTMGRTGKRFHLVLEPTLPLPRGGPLDDVHHDTWSAMLSARVPL